MVGYSAWTPQTDSMFRGVQTATVQTDVCGLRGSAALALRYQARVPDGGLGVHTQVATPDPDVTARYVGRLALKVVL
jgi:hypothetical protein